MIEDLKNIWGALLPFVLESEATGAAGVDKKKMATEKIMAAIKSDGGIHVGSGLILRWLPAIVSALIELWVWEVAQLKK